jgi:hypothetical protein
MDLKEYTKPLLLVVSLNIFLSVGAYFVAYQFNDGKKLIDIYGSSATVVAIFNLALGRLMRMLRYPEAWVFLGFGILAGVVALVLGLFFR